MRFVVGLFDTFHGNMGVNLGRREVGMAEHRLHAAQISTIVQQMSSKAMAKFVRAGAKLD